jgi:signal transduction histidine kinase
MLVDDVWDLMSADVASDVEFVADIPDDFEIEADGDQIFRLIHNLVRNAVEALQQGQEPDPAIVRRITVSAKMEGRTTLIFVDDTGPGLPKKARENLFSAFKGSVRSGGTGLGLAIVHELVTAHGGTISLVDKETTGTCFRIDLPDQAPVKKRDRKKP